MIPMVAVDLTPTLVPYGLVALVLTAAGLIATLVLIVRDAKLRSRAIVEVPERWNRSPAIPNALGVNHPADATDWTVCISAKVQGLDATTTHPIHDVRDVDTRQSLHQ